MKMLLSICTWLTNLFTAFNPGTITIAEEMSGMPGISSPTERKDMDLITGFQWEYPISGLSL